MKKVFGLFGCGGHGRETMSFINNFDKDEIKFVDDLSKLSSVNDIEVISSSDFFKLNSTEKYFNVSIADPFKRKEIVNTFIQNNCKPVNLIAPTSQLNNFIEFGEGLILGEYSYIAPNTKIGSFFHLNRHSQVSHDCVIGEYVTFGPQVSCNGNVHIHSHAFIGCGALIKQGNSNRPLTIGEGAVIGMGAVITKDVEPYTTVIGNPAAVLKN